MTGRLRPWLIIWAGIILAMVLAGCAETKSGRMVPRPCPVEKLALAPFQVPWPCTDPDEVACPVSGEIFPRAVVPSTARQELTSVLPSAAEGVYSCPLVLPNSLAGALPAMPSSTGPAVVEALAEAGRKVGAETVIVGTVFRFQERVGTEAGITQPASVELALYAIDTQTRTVVWQGMFSETQRSLSENLFQMGDFFQRGARWLTAAELGRAGMVKLISRMRFKASP